MAIDDKVIATPSPKDDEYQSIYVACSAEFGTAGCKNPVADADNANEKQ